MKNDYSIFGFLAGGSSLKLSCVVASLLVSSEGFFFGELLNHFNNVTPFDSGLLERKTKYDTLKSRISTLEKS